MRAVAGITRVNIFIIDALYTVRIAMIGALIAIIAVPVRFRPSRIDLPTAEYYRRERDRIDDLLQAYGKSLWVSFVPFGYAVYIYARDRARSTVETVALGSIYVVLVLVVYIAIMRKLRRDWVPVRDRLERSLKMAQGCDFARYKPGATTKSRATKVLSAPISSITTCLIVRFSRLTAAAKILVIRVLDHVVFGEAEYFSFADAGLLGDTLVWQISISTQGRRRFQPESCVPLVAVYHRNPLLGVGTDFFMRGCQPQLSAG